MCDQTDGSLRSRYLGCSGRSLHARLLEHRYDIVKRKQKNAMAKHMQAMHPEVTDQYSNVTSRIIGLHHSTLVRVVDESLRLEKGIGLANGKGEFGRGGGLVLMHPARTQQDVLNLDPGG